MRVAVLAVVLLAAAAASAGAAPSTPACRTSQLSVSQRGLEGGVGHFGEFFVLTNHGSACTVKGYLDFRLLDARRRPMPTGVGHGSTYLHGKDTGPKLVLLTRGGHAKAWAEWSDVPSGNEPLTKACEPTSSYIRVTPPGNSTGIVVRFTEMVCGHGGFLTSALTR